MSTSTPPEAAEPRLHPWQSCLDIEAQDGGHYLDFVNEPMLRAVDGAPRRVLELGCAAGMLGSTLKERFPGVHVTGIEAGQAAAAIAATRIDRVIPERIEQVDFAARGFAAGEFDTVLAGDILEHLVDPWRALQSVRPYLAPGGQLVASIPNVRNLQVVQSLVLDGRWRYAERGLLDVTHLRFFTFEEIREMFAQTGYVLEHFLFTLSPALTALFREIEGKDKVSLRFGRLSIEDVTRREAVEFCAEQFVVRARPAP